MTPPPLHYNINSEVEVLLTRSGVNPENFRSKSVLVTGGTGFFGIWMLKSLERVKNQLGGHLKIYLLTRNANGFKRLHPELGCSEAFEFVEGCIQDENLRLPAVTHLVHMATTSAAETFAGENHVNKVGVLFRGTQNVLEKLGPSLESMVFTSSGVVYGAKTTGLFRESDLSRPDNLDPQSGLAYGKLIAEYLVSAYAVQFGYKFAIARCFAFIGPYLPLDLHYAAGNFVADALSGRPIVIKGTGLERRSYLHVGDAIAWLLRMLTNAKNNVYNVGSARSITIRELAEIVSRQSGKNLPVSIQNRKLVEGNFSRSCYTPDTTKIKQDLPGLKEWTSIEASISSMLSPVNLTSS